MSGKRNFIQEIKDFVKRSAVPTQTGAPENARLSALIGIWSASRDIKDEEISDEIRRHVVVSLVALIQGNVRRTIAAIVDAKEKQGKDLPDPPNVKISLATVRELKNREFSTGQFVAHFLLLNSFEQISSALYQVSATDLNAALLERFRASHKRIAGVEDPDKALATAKAILVSLFYYRNIYCHEDGIGVAVTDKQIYEFITTTITVVSALGDLRSKAVAQPKDSEIQHSC